MLILTIVVADLLLLGVVVSTYSLVIRRRLRIYMLVETLATMAQHGLPLHAALRMLGRDFGGHFGLQLGLVARAVEDGRRLDEAFDLHPQSFPPLLRSMIRLGCRGGNLAAALDSARQSYRYLTETPSRSVFFFLYPVLLCVLVNIFTGLLGVGLKPKFEEIWTSLGQRDIPALISWDILVATSQGLMVAGVLLALFVVLGLAPQHYGVSPRRFRAWLDRVVLWIPFVASVARSTSWSRFAFGTGLMLRAGGRLDEAVELASEAESNQRLRAGLDRAVARIREGARASTALRDEAKAPEDLVWFFEAGESSGALADHLMQAGEHFDARVRFAGYSSTRLVVPILVLMNGAIVVMIYGAMFHPFVSLWNKLTA